MTKAEKQMEITKRILSAGGKYVHVVGDEAEVDMIMKKGQFFEGETAVVEGGEHMLCHDNSLKFYLGNEGMRLCTGYAGSQGQDGEYMWVNHSWCVDKDGIVHECTPIKRDKYYGAIMDEREAERFRRGIDYAYDAECKRREEMGVEESYKEETLEENIENVKLEKGIRGWVKKIISKIRSRHTPTLGEAKEQRTEEKSTSLLESLQGNVNETIEYDEKEEIVSKEKQLDSKDDVVI